jgi:hypothetical protein
MQPIKLNPQQQQEFAAKFNERMKRVTMSWDNELREWHKIALHALNFSNVRVMQIPQHLFIDLFKEEKQGLNMNVVQVLCNNMEDRSASEMGYTAREWADILVMNQRIATRWQELSAPEQKALYKEYEIMNNKLRIIAQA